MTTILSRTKYAAGYQSTPIVLMDRVYNIAGAAITQASISTIVYRVDRYASQQDAEGCDNGTVVDASESLTVSSTVYDTLQTAAPWDSEADPEGYNVRFTLPAAMRAAEGWHRVTVMITPATGEAYPLVWIIETLANTAPS